MKDRIVRVEWIDSGGTARWVSREEASKEKICHCVTYGIVVGEDESVLIVAQSLDIGNNTVCHIMTIPKIAINEVREMRLK